MTQYQAVGVGNAVVDVISQCDDRFLARMGIDKGVMQLVGQERGAFLYHNMADRTQMAGGSVANTIAGLGALGLSTAFIGRVCDDGPGRDYVADMARALRTGRVHRANGRLAYHVLDLMHSFHDASREERHVHVSSTVERPTPLPVGLATFTMD